MIKMIFLSILASPHPGPLVGFIANFSSVSAQVHFTQKVGKIDYDIIENGHLWTTDDALLNWSPTKTTNGEWGFDGRTERFLYGAPVVGVADRTKEHRIEVLYDGATAAWHTPTSRTINASKTSNPAVVPIVAYGPFNILGLRFPAFLEEKFPDTSPNRLKAERGGRPVEVEIYRKDITGGWHQVEIAYDPSVNYLPRYARSVTLKQKEDNALIREYYLLDSRYCTSGGFVPTKWVTVSFYVQGFLSQYPDYNSETVIRRSGSASLTLFAVTKFENLSSQVALSFPSRARAISAPGGMVRLKDEPQTLTLQRITTATGERLNPRPIQTLPIIDRAELAKYDQKSKPQIYYRVVLFIILFICFILLMIIILIKKKFKISIYILILIITIFSNIGCNGNDRNIYKLRTELSPSHLIYNVNRNIIKVKLLLYNHGTLPMRIFRVDGGCTCRQIDQSLFPVTLHPNKFLNIDTSLTANKVYDAQVFRFSLETDNGTLIAPVKLLALPSHALSPDSIAGGHLRDGDVWTFEITHREVYVFGAERARYSLVTPDAFSVTKLGTKSGRIDIAPEFGYQDTNYRLSLRDLSRGLHKSTLAVRRVGDSQIMVEKPVVWQRHPFLSSSPDTIILGSKPVRTFLRCSDESVELTKLLSAPEGLKVTISSTCELLVQLTENAPGIIDGIIEVGTTAENRPPLRIPVVRYAPAVGR